jgi:hypothetical protein
MIEHWRQAVVLSMSYASDEALFHPVIKELENLTCEMITIDNVSLQLVAFFAKRGSEKPVRLGHGIIQ